MGIPVTNSTLRELVSQSIPGKLDESAPLSASDLIALLENLRARSEEIKEKVRKTVTTYDKEFLHIIAQADQTVVNVEKISRELEHVLELVGEKNAIVNKPGGSISPADASSPRKTGVDKKRSAQYDNDNILPVPVDVEICQLAAEMRRLRCKIKERQEALALVQTISSLHDRLLATEKKINPSSLVQAAEGLVILKEKLGLQGGHNDDVPQDQDLDVSAFKLLRDAWSERYTKLFDLLEDLMSKVIVLDERRSELMVTPNIVYEMVGVASSSEGVELSSIFDAMDVLGVLDMRLARLGDEVFKWILGPLLKNSQTVISTLVLASGDKSTGRRILKWTLGIQTAEAVPDLLYPKIIQVIKFFNNHVFGNHDLRMARFGCVVWPRLAEAIIAGCLSKAVPDQFSQLKDFENITRLTANFEKELAVEGFIANFDQARGDKLSTFASNVEVHFALKKKKHMLAKARDLLMQFDYSLSKSRWKSFDDNDNGRDGSIYLLPEPCAISIPAISLLATVHEALKDACLSTPWTALEMYHASRDAILLYRAIIPVKICGKLNRMQVGALCHNDCLYIAHDLITFLYQYREELPLCLKTVFTFVDLVPLFRQMAGEVLDQEVMVIKADIMECLDHANGFQYIDDEKQFQLAHRALDKVFVIFANMAAMVRPVLARTVYEKVMGGLINMVIGRVIQEVLSINDIAVQETVQLQKLLRILEQKLPPFLAPEVVDVSEKCELEATALKKLVSLWQKLETLISRILHSKSPRDIQDVLQSLTNGCHQNYSRRMKHARHILVLCNLLDMSLVSINQAWESGYLTSCGFAPSEVQKLIKAIFSETSLREECLYRVAHPHN